MKPINIRHKCKGCKKRYPGCHDKCEEYQQIKENINAVKESKRNNSRDGGISRNLRESRIGKKNPML